MSDSIKISGLVVAHNEAEQLADCLGCLSFCDEIVVVLDRCTDSSRQIAIGCGARVVEGEWLLEGPRRQAGQEACQGRWILEIDADERVPEALGKEIDFVLSAREETKDGPDWWRLPFDNYIGGKLVRYGWGANFGVGAKAVLYRKGMKRWESQRVHPKVKMLGFAGPNLQTPVKHFVDENISDMIRRLDRYTTLRAQDLVEGGEVGTMRKNVARIFGRFWKCYVLRKGYREGVMGFVIALFAGLYPFLSYAKAVELQGDATEVNPN